MALTDTGIKNAKPAKLFDGGGLFLLIAPILCIVLRAGKIEIPS